MDDSTQEASGRELTAAEKRAQQAEARRLKILARANDRLAKVTGVYAGDENETDAAAEAPSSSAAANDQPAAGPSPTRAAERQPEPTPAPETNAEADNQAQQQEETQEAAEEDPIEFSTRGAEAEAAGKKEGGGAPAALNNESGPRLPSRAAQQAARERAEKQKASLMNLAEMMQGGGAGGPSGFNPLDPSGGLFGSGAGGPMSSLFSNMMNAGGAPAPSGPSLAAHLEAALAWSTAPRLFLSVLVALLTFAVHLTGGALSKLGDLIPNAPLPPAVLPAVDQALREAGLTSLLMNSPVLLLIVLYAALLMFTVVSVRLGVIKAQPPPVNLPFFFKILPGVEAMMRKGRVAMGLLGGVVDLCSVYLVVVGILMGVRASKAGALDPSAKAGSSIAG